MENLREILESKTKEELAYLIGLGYHQKDKRLSWVTNKRDIERMAKVAFEVVFGSIEDTPKPKMIKKVLFHIGKGNLRPEQI